MRTAGDGEPVSAARREHPTGHHDQPVDGGQPADSVLSVDSDRLIGRRKAAILLVLLGSELASDILKHLDEAEIEQLSLEIAQLEAIAPEDQVRALAEFQELMLERDPAPGGGLDYARAVLERSLGADKAAAVVDRVARIMRPRPFGFMRRTDPSQLLSFLRDEHPQTIALILAYLDPGAAAGLLASLPYAMQGDVARRIATLDLAAPEVVHEVERVLQHKLARSSRPAAASDRGATAGLDAIVTIFHLMDRTTEQSVIDALEQEDPDLAQDVKQRLFGFEDLLLLDDEALRAVLREVSRQELAAALKAVDAEILERVLRNMSKRGAALLRDAMERLGPIRLGEVEEAQRRVAGVIRSLQQRGEIAIDHR
jgi:flagellar motor switch protein FliG